MKKGRLRKLAIIAIIAAVVGAAWGFDAIWATTYRIEVVSITPEKPVADNTKPVEIVLRLTHFGKPVEGHTLNALPENGGTMEANNVMTDADGFAVYKYFPYSEGYILKARPVTVYVQDEDNSFIIEVNARMRFTIDLQSPEAV